MGILGLVVISSAVTGCTALNQGNVSLQQAVAEAKVKNVEITLTYILNNKGSISFVLISPVTSIISGFIFDREEEGEVKSY